MMKKKIKLNFFKFLSYSPIFRLTNDSNFGEVKNDKIQSKRISFFSLNFGQIIFHLFTYDVHRKTFKFYYILRLKDVCNYPDNETINKHYDAYKEEINLLSRENINIHKESLLYKIEQLENTKNKAFNKYIAYLAVIAFMIPLYVPLFKHPYSIVFSYKLIFILILSYILMNLLFFFNSFIRVSSYDRITFNLLRTSNKPLIQLTLSTYYEWQAIKSESEFQVTLIKNIEKYMKGFVIISLLIFGVYSTEKLINLIPENVQSAEDGISSSVSRYSFKDIYSKSTFLQKNDDKLSDMKKQLLKKEKHRIIVISNTQSYNDEILLDFLNVYNTHSTDIIEVVSPDVININIIILGED